MIKCGEGEDPIGVCTAFSLRRAAQLKSLAELQGFLRAHCPDEGGKEALDKARRAGGLAGFFRVGSGVGRGR